MKAEVTAVVGAQYGSEGKGAVVQRLANEYDVHIRTGGPNAGHTIDFENDRFAMQVIPCGWINDQAKLIIGPGALVDIEQLRTELTWIESYDPAVRERIFIDAKAGFLSKEFQKAEGGVKGELHKRIGSTGKGVGAAREARMRRDPDKFSLIGDKPPKDIRELIHHDTVKLVHRCVQDREAVLLEGAQGAGLSLVHGSWPYVTSSDTNAATMLADAGLAPTQLTGCVLVARAWPIRVAGNSGPLKNEMTWDEVSEHVGRKVEERTTVTKKVRRIGKWDSDLFIKAVRLNAPSSIALTFLDYPYPEVYEAEKESDLSANAIEFIEAVEHLAYPARVRFIGTGPHTMIDRGGFA